MNVSAAASQPAGPAGASSPEHGAWPRTRWVMVVALIFAAHIGLLFAFGAHKRPPVRPVADVPTLRLANPAEEWIALSDPTLFALPHTRDFAAMTRMPPAILKPPAFRWNGPGGEWPGPGAELGAVFDEFMRTNRFAHFELQLKPPLTAAPPEAPVETVLAQTSTMAVRGDLARRAVVNSPDIPSLPYNDVIVPSTVQVLVDPAGNVVSAALLPPDNPAETASRYDVADRLALDLARSVRFAAGPELAVGQLVFNWHTVPATTTNEPSQ